MNTTATELDLALVPGFESELRCESSHDVRPEFVKSCTFEATYKLTSRCDGDSLFCCNGRIREMAIGAVELCASCGYGVQECWKVVPV